ncbi:phospholipase D family protein [Rosenbergiella collisarenosi]|uniref:phospholipase D family nuclease n=1 Tax=Rosenbergiella collisarenosi TaxID=1544695 RepID=UPI001F4DEC2E|nr:phospholipase D family protein [Rosenbergiella collisarenosi]
MKKYFIPLLFMVSSCAHATHLDVGFSPEGTAKSVVLRAIGSAQSSIHMMAYSFTAPDIMRELVKAHQRGVDIKIVVDEKGNTAKNSIAAMNYIVNNGISLKVDSDFKIQHDKVIIVDGKTVELGSFNFTVSAERYNSENALVIYDNTELANVYDKHWLDRWNRGVVYKSSY